MNLRSSSAKIIPIVPAKMTSHSLRSKAAVCRNCWKKGTSTTINPIAKEIIIAIINFGLPKNFSEKIESSLLRELRAWASSMVMSIINAKVDARVRSAPGEERTKCSRLISHM